MAQILAVIKLEWKQQLRSGFILLVLAVAVLYANPFSTTSPNLWENLSRTVSGPSMLVLSLLLGLFGILSAQRERRQNVAVLVDSWAISGHNLFIGQWLGLVFTMLNLLIALHLIVGGIMLATGVRLSVIALLKSLVVICFPWGLFMLTIGFVLGSFIPIFISMPAVGGIWYATSVLAFFDRLGEWLPAPWKALVDPSTISAASASISFGFLPAGRILTNRIFYLGVSLLILAIGALFYKRSRENRFNRGIIGLSFLGFGAIVLAITISWGQFLATTNQTFRGVEPPSVIHNAQTNLNQIQAESYEIELNTLPDRKGMRVNVLMSIRNIGEQAMDSFVFILNDDLVIDKIAAVFGKQPLEWQKHEGGYYQIQMAEPLGPEKATSISISYSGSISEWYSPGG